MRAQGKLTEWNDLRGFGFLVPLERGERVFVHISAFPSGSRRPTNGEFVSYTLGADERGRPCATQVTYVVSRAKRFSVRTRAREPELIAVLVAVAFLGVVVLLGIVGRLWWPLPSVYIVMSMLTYAVYKHDKQAAQAGAWRTNEWTLIVLGLIGGWPGALIARHRFRHKTRKIPYRLGYWLSVVVNLAGLAWLIGS